MLSYILLFMFSSDTNMFVSSANNTIFDPIIFRGFKPGQSRRIFKGEKNP